MTDSNAIDKVCACIMWLPNVHRATKYLSPTRVITITRVGRFVPRVAHGDYRLKVGMPNYREREFIKLALKAGEKFPIRKVQLQFYPRKK